MAIVLGRKGGGSGGGGGLPEGWTQAGNPADVDTQGGSLTGLPIGPGQVLGEGGVAVYPPGHELEYAEITTNATTTQTVRASASTWLTAPSITFDGATAVIIEVFFSVLTNDTNGAGTNLVLWEGSTDLATLGQFQVTGQAYALGMVYARHRLTPTAGAKVYTVRAYVSTASTGTGGAGNGLAGTRVPAFIRITMV